MTSPLNQHSFIQLGQLSQRTDQNSSNHDQATTLVQRAFNQEELRLENQIPHETISKNELSQKWICKTLDHVHQNTLLYFDLVKAVKIYLLMKQSVPNGLLNKVPTISLIAGIIFGVIRIAIGLKKYVIDHNKTKASQEAAKGVLEIVSGILGTLLEFEATASLTVNVDKVIFAWDVTNFIMTTFENWKARKVFKSIAALMITILTA